MAAIRERTKEDNSPVVIHAGVVSQHVPANRPESPASNYITRLSNNTEFRREKEEVEVVRSNQRPKRNDIFIVKHWCPKF